MRGAEPVYKGGCLCGALRWEASAPPRFAGFCFCADCRRSSGSGFIPFMGFAAEHIRFSGEARQIRSPAITGGEAVRNRCAACGSLVYGGEVGRDAEHTVYAGSLDDPSLFEPQVAIFVRDKPDWVSIPAGVAPFETMPG